MRMILSIVLLILSSTGSHASSSDAEAEFAVAVAEACSGSSGLDETRTSALIGFDDSLNKVAMLVSGVFPQPFMDRAEGTMLCIYDKTTGTTWIDEASGWIAPGATQPKAE